MKEDWELKTLGEVCTLQRGFDLPQQSRINGIFPLVSSSGIIDTHNTYKVKAPGVTTGRSGSIGNVFYINDDFWPLNTVLYVKNFHGNNPRFIYYLLIKFDLIKFAGGAGVPTLNRNNVHNQIISVPKSLSEQQRIVEILDEVFSGIAKIKANTQRNLKNARELFASYLQNILSNPGDDWEIRKLGEVCSIEKNTNNNKNLPYVGMEDIESNTSVFLGSLDIKNVKSSTFYFTSEHILYGRLRPYLNKVLIPDFNGHCSTEIFPIKVSKIGEKKYLLYWLKWDKIVNKINDTCTGTRMPRANMKEVLTFEIPLPPLSEQKAIVAKLEALSEETKRLERIYQQKLDDLEELKKSILEKAFKGELTG